MKTFITVALAISPPTLATETSAMSSKNICNPDNRRISIFLILLSIAAPGFFAVIADGQIVRNTNFSPDKTLKSNARVNPSTFAMDLSIPIAGFPGRAGNSMPVAFNYTSKLWNTRSFIKPTYSGWRTEVEPYFGERSAAGWTSTLASPRLEYPSDQYFGSVYGFEYEGESYGGTPPDQFENFPLYYIKRMRVVIPGGSSHEFRASDTPITGGSTLGGYTPDYTGTYLSVDNSKMRLEMSASPITLYMPDGSRYQFGSGGNGFATAYIDVNGNKMTYSDSAKQWTDTMGRVLDNPLPSHVGSTQSQTVGEQEIELPGFDGEPYTATLSWRNLKHATSTDPDDSGLGNLSLELAYKANYYCTPTSYSSISGTHLFSETDYLMRTCNYGASAPGPVFNPVVLTKITLANGQSYQFKYNLYGEIEKIVYPTGGYERLTYGGVPPLQVSKFPYDQVNRGVTHRYVSEKGDGTDEVHWSYSASTGITMPDGTRTQQLIYRETDPDVHRPYGFNDAKTGLPFETRIYSSTNVLLSRTLTQYDMTEAPTGQYGNLTATRDVRPAKEISIVFEPGNSNALATMTETIYDTAGNSDPAYFSSLNPKQIKKYNYIVVSASTATSASVTTAAGWFSSGDLAAVSETDYLYDANYKARNITGLATETRVKDPAGNVKAKAQIIYDGLSLLSESTSTRWVDPSTPYRGLVTKTRSWYDIPGNLYIDSQAQCDLMGNLRKSWDGRNNLSETQYSSTYDYAFPTSVTTPIPDDSGANGSNAAFTSSTVYDYNTGLTTSVTDANSQTATMLYEDPLLRPTKVTAPNGAETVTEYGAGTDSSTRWVKVTSDIDETNSKYAISWFDGLGRNWFSHSEDSAGDVFAVICYDNMGRVSKTSNPFRNVSNPSCSSSLEWTTPAYDDLGRTISVTTPDGAVVETAYGLATVGSQIGTTVTVEDQAGKQRRSITDALGQLSRVDEPDNSSATGSLGAINAPYQPTIYGYDILNNLISVLQEGNTTGECGGSTSSCSQTRSFTYDALSRLKSSSNPESGTINYTYDNNGNLATKVDARNITTTYSYDRLNRVTLRAYTNEPSGSETANVTYYYDNLTNANGKLTKVSSSVSTTEYLAFDVLGRVTQSRQTTDGVTYGNGTTDSPMTYTYNLSGALVEQQYPSGRVVKNTFDAVDGSLSQVQSKRSAETYRNFANGFIYNPAGAMTAVRLGNGKWENTVFNSRLQPSQIGLGNGVSSQNLLRLEYSYGTTQNNGNVQSQTITIPGVTLPFVQTYSYDSLNRLSQASEKPSGWTDTNCTSDPTKCWKQTFKFDRYGNRNFDTSGTNTTTLPANFDPDIYNPTISTTNNRFDSGQGYSYDNAGNTTRDAESRRFTYDAENKQTKVETLDSNGNPIATVGEYVYDGDGKRVMKVVPGGETTVFIYDAGGKLIGEYSTVVQPTLDAKTAYTTNDNLGSPRINTDGVGAVVSRHDYYPFGDKVDRSSISYGSDTIRQRFTGYERDEETGLDFAQARVYSSVLGRFFSVDPIIESAEADLPASWNRYAYALNSPYIFTDPTGEKWLQSRTNSNEYLWVADDVYARNSEYYDALYRNADGAQIFLRSTPEGSPYSHLKGQYVTLVPNALSPVLKRCGYCGGHALGNADDHLLSAFSLLRGLMPLFAATRAATTATAAASQVTQRGPQIVVSSKAVVDRSPSVLNHIFKTSAGHLGRNLSAANKERYLKVFEAVASNPANKLSSAEAVARGFIPPQAAAAGSHVFTKTLSNGKQVWVFVRNGMIRDAGVNIGGGVR